MALIVGGVVVLVAQVSWGANWRGALAVVLRVVAWLVVWMVLFAWVVGDGPAANLGGGYELQRRALGMHLALPDGSSLEVLRVEVRPNALFVEDGDYKRPSRYFVIDRAAGKAELVGGLVALQARARQMGVELHLEEAATVASRNSPLWPYWLVVMGVIGGAVGFIFWSSRGVLEALWN